MGKNINLSDFCNFPQFDCNTVDNSNLSSTYFYLARLLKRVRIWGHCHIFFYEMLGFGAFYRKNGKNVLSHHHFQLSDAIIAMEVITGDDRKPLHRAIDLF